MFYHPKLCRYIFLVFNVFTGATCTCTCMCLIILSLQQDEVLAELKEYARSDPKPQDAQEVELVISYLEALNNIFERSILGNKVRVFDANGTTLQRMEGFTFFSKWAKENKDDEDRKSFLAWQVSILYTCVCISIQDYLHCSVPLIGAHHHMHTILSMY